VRLEYPFLPVIGELSTQSRQKNRAPEEQTEEGQSLRKAAWSMLLRKPYWLEQQC